MLDNGFLTDIRTAAAGALAADLLARKFIQIVGVIGLGVQARQQVRCLAGDGQAIPPCHRVEPAIAQISSGTVRRCRQKASRRLPRHQLQDVCQLADVLITATPSRKALVSAEWLKEGVHVTALGSDSPGKQELMAECLDSADLVVVDRFAQCAAFGELPYALDAGLLTRNDVHAELARVCRRSQTGPDGHCEITIADLTGVGFQDTAIASAALAWVQGAFVSAV